MGVLELGSTLCAPFFNNSHRHTGYTTDDFRLRRIVEVPDRLARLRMRNHHQLPLLKLAPATAVSVSQLKENHGDIGVNQHKGCAPLPYPPFTSATMVMPDFPTENPPNFRAFCSPAKMRST
jgi:hypothetical protein